MNHIAASSEAPLQRKRFLIVDDIAARSELAERYLLLGSALQVRKVASPLAALRVLQDPRTPVDCTLCAQDFKPMSGLEFLQNLRTGRYGGRTLSESRFILMLRKPDAQVIAAAQALRASGHVVGAFNRDSLTEVVIQALNAPHEQADDATVPGVPVPSDIAKPGMIRVAHIREQGVDLVIVPMESGFGAVSPQEQNDRLNVLRDCVARARLQGEVIPVWDMGEGAMAFLAPKGFHPYFQSINLDFVRANLNREISVV